MYSSRRFFNDIHQPSINPILNLLPQVQIRIYDTLIKFVWFFFKNIFGTDLRMRIAFEKTDQVGHIWNARAAKIQQKTHN